MKCAARNHSAPAGQVLRCSKEATAAYDRVPLCHTHLRVARRWAGTPENYRAFRRMAAFWWDLVARERTAE
jgi:hypothetical protein